MAPTDNQACLFNDNILTARSITTNTFSSSHKACALSFPTASACKSDSLKGLRRTPSLPPRPSLSAPTLYTMHAALIAIPLCNYKLSCD